MPSPPAGFAHLHNHTTYSLLDGAQRLDEMCARAAEDGQAALAITDHGNLFGAMAFGKAAARHGVKPIIGIEAYVAPESRFDKKARPGRKNYHHLVLLARNYSGYKNLIKLASAGYLEGFYHRPRIDRELLEQHHEGLICLSGCLAGEVPTALRRDRYDDAVRHAAWYRDLFGPERYWLEIQDHGIDEQKLVNDGSVKLAEDLGIGLVATNDCHYLLPDDHTAHEILVCIHTGKTIQNRGRMTYTTEHYLKTGAEMKERFRWRPDAVENSLAIAELCDFTFEDQPNHLPEFPVPDGYDLDGYFEKIARNGFEFRMKRWKAEEEAGRLEHPLEDYRKRLDRELKVIREMGFSGYFLITWDFIRYARDHDIPVGPGRGSAAGSLVAYCMRITDIDPMQYNLLFERFLNPERVSMPDVDIDFCFRKREQVIDYVTGKYGRPNVAQIITFGSMAARAVVRDVGRVMEISYGDVDKIAKLIPNQPGKEVTLESALREVPELKNRYENDPQVRQLLDVGKRLEGLCRHASTHAAGVVIAPEPIQEFAPLYRGTKENDEVTTQWAKDEVEEIGLLKMDFLGLKTLTLIDDALASIARDTGRRPDLESIPLDDPKVYELFSRAMTDGVFQFESDGMKDILRRLRPERFEDLVALNALFRPGPIGGGLIDDFIKRRHGKIRVEYPHPWTEEILKETYGVIVYQEQVMQIASRMAGYSLGEADILRRAMGKKKKEVMEAEAKKFIAGAEKKGISAGDAKTVFELMAYFAGYGFNKSHSAAYALVAYQTAWLKAHYPVHFMAAVLTNDKGNTDKLVQYIGRAREMGIQVLPPDVNRSGLDFAVEGENIRFGLSAIKGAGEGVIQEILAAREKLGRFHTFHELCGAVETRQMNKRVAEALIFSGALDSLGARRAQLAAALDAALEYGQKRRADRRAGQGNLFDGGDRRNGEAPRADSLPDVPEWDERILLRHEKESLGFYISGHPLESHSRLIRDFASHTTGALAGAAPGSEVAVCGLITGLGRRKSRKGAWFATFQLEDVEGRVETVIFPKTYRTCNELLENDKPFLVTGRLAAEEDSRIKILADDICPLADLRDKKAGAVQVSLDTASLDREQVERLRKACSSFKGDAQLFLEVARPGRYRLVAKAENAMNVRPCQEFTDAVDRILGPGKVRYRAAPRHGGR